MTGVRNLFRGSRQFATRAWRGTVRRGSRTVRKGSRPPSLRGSEHQTAEVLRNKTGAVAGLVHMAWIPDSRRTW